MKELEKEFLAWYNGAQEQQSAHTQTEKAVRGDGSGAKSRRFSVDGDFMNYGTNDLLYAYMRSISTAMPCGKSWLEYLKKKNYLKDKKLIADICGCSTKAIDNALKKLIDCGLIEEGKEVFTQNGKNYEYEVYYFPFDYYGPYTLIDIQVLRYIVNTRSKQAIRVYMYLLHKYEWKKAYENEDYIFTVREIKKAMGYSETTKTADKLIKDILISLRTEGLINYEKFVEQIDIGTANEVKYIPVERMKLKFVLNDGARLPDFDNQ